MLKNILLIAAFIAFGLAAVSDVAAQQTGKSRKSNKRTTANKSFVSSMEFEMLNNKAPIKRNRAARRKITKRPTSQVYNDNSGVISDERRKPRRRSKN